MCVCAFVVAFELYSVLHLQALCGDSRRTDLLFAVADVWTVLLLLPWRLTAIFLLIFWHQELCAFSDMENNAGGSLLVFVWFASQVYIL